MIRMTGAELIVHLIKRQGIDQICGIPGGGNLPLYNALATTKLLDHVLARHEQGAGFIAHGMARTTGKPAVFFATSGPGATNAMTAIADAKLDSIPLVCFTGQVPLSMIGTDAFQEVDSYGLSIPITKHNFLVRSAHELLEIIPTAFRIAASDRPGPVLIDVPKDIQAQEVRFHSWPEPGKADAYLPPSKESLEKAAQIIAESKKPMILFGGGVCASSAMDEAREFAEKINSPVAMTLTGLGSLPHDHPLALGMIGMHGARCTNFIADACDTLLVIGARFDDRVTGRMDGFCPNARIIHIDIDIAELDKLRQTDVAVLGDVRECLQALMPLIDAAKLDRAEWTEQVEALRKSDPLILPGIDDPCTPYGLVRCAWNIAGPESIAVTDVGQHQMRTAQAFPVDRPRQLLTSAGLGTMGFGLPAAIGAAISCPDVPVLCFSGDGSLLMNIQELVTAAELKANVKVIIANNRALGLVQQQQELFYDNNIIACLFEYDVDFVQVAKGFGVPGVDLGKVDNPLEAMKMAIETPGPYIINVPIPVDSHVYPMVPPGAANTTMIGGENNE